MLVELLRCVRHWFLQKYNVVQAQHDSFANEIFGMIQDETVDVSTLVGWAFVISTRDYEFFSPFGLIAHGRAIIVLIWTEHINIVDVESSNSPPPP